MVFYDYVDDILISGSLCDTGLRTVEFEHCNRLLLSVYVVEDSSQRTG
jgi:hypothetical protein